MTNPRLPPWTSVLLGAAALLAACSEAINGTGLISQKIGEAARAPAAREIDLARLTGFGWDRFHFFPTGTPRDEICGLIGASRAHCGRIIRHDRTPADAVTLVFALGPSKRAAGEGRDTLWPQTR